jgi:predicted dehydrogenase
VTTSDGGSRAPDGAIGVALIGFGYWGPNYARVLNELEGIRFTAVCDRDADRLAQMKRRYPGVATCERTEDLFSRGDVDAVIIATPAATHEALVSDALAAGRHVLVEKPAALSVEGCDALCVKARDAKRVLMVGYTFLYNSAVRKMKEWVSAADFGGMYYLHATRTNLGPIRHDVNAVWDLAPHDVAIFNYLLGERPRWASAVGTSVLRNRREDIAFATLGYSGDVLGNIHVSWADPNKVREVVAVGSRRRVVFNDLNDAERVRVFERGVSVGDTIAESFGEFKLLVRDGDIISPKVEPGEPLKNQCADFVHAMTTGQPPLADGEFAAGVVRGIAAIEASMQARGAAVDVAA